MGALGYDTLAHYTSLTDGDYIFALKKLGYSSYWMEVCSNGGTRITDAVLANKYTVGSKALNQNMQTLFIQMICLIFIKIIYTCLLGLLQILILMK